MPTEQKSRREIINAIQQIPSLSEILAMQEGHYVSELDLEIVVYGRNYNGKKVGPYVRLLTYSPEEIVTNQGEWSSDAFYFVIRGTAEVYEIQPDGKTKKVSEIFPGLQFGERAVLAGTRRNATVKAPKNESLQVLEVQRPAIRLLRKLPKVSEVLDRSYRTYAKRTFLNRLRSQGYLSDSPREVLEKISRFRVLSKHHLLVKENSPIEALYLIKEGWLRRTRIPVESRSTVCRQCGKPSQQDELFCSNCGFKLVDEEFQGKGFCFGMEGLLQESQWPFTVVLMGRTELLEVPFSKLSEHPEVRSFLAQNWSRFAPAPFGARKLLQPSVEKKISSAQEKLIQTGLVDGTNLLVMDMDLCVRCGNCSLACHKVHGQSRLLREGIHVSRLRKGRSGGLQSVLAPAVCLHCKDPECLSGCPTGAISRREEGQIDIQPKTCIGCGDCAAQCPYHAISLISRKKPTAVSSLNWKNQIQDWLRIRLDPLPPAVDQTEDLVAVKCNLCANTGLNPPDQKQPAYSCELNCPTGALARIHPESYFNEIGEIEGLKFLDQTHAIGRNIHVADPPKKWIHAGSILISILVTALIVYGMQKYGLGGRIVSFLNMRWITGLVGLVVMTLVMLYPFRRQIYKRRATPLRYWMLIHGYSGILTAIVFVLHGGSDSGGLLTTVLMISFDLVILTGLFGIVAYLIVPRILTSIEDEPLLLDSLVQKRKELQSELGQVLASAGEDLKRVILEKVIPHFTSLSYLFSQYRNRETLDQMLLQARAKFDTQKLKMPEMAQEDLITAIDSVATIRRLDALIYLHQILKIWLPPHVVSTSLMLALMFVHIVQVIFFLWR